MFFAHIKDTMNMSPIGSRTIKIDIRTLACDVKPPDHNGRSTNAQDLLSQIDYRFLFDRTYDAILLTDSNGHILSWNDRALQFFGYSEETLARLTLQEVIAGLNEMLLSTIRETVQQGQHMRIQAFSVLKNGELNAVELVITGNGPKEPNRFCCLVKNIQSRWQAEQNLTSAYHAMDNTDAGIGIVNMQGIIIYSNRMMTRLLADGDEKGILGKPLSLWFDQEAFLKPLLEQIALRQPWSGEHSFLIGQKSCCFSLSAVPDISSDNELTGMVISIQDIAERRRMEVAEQQAARNRTLLESLGSICHALTQPTTVLLTSIELLKLEIGLDEAQRKEMIALCYETVLEMREQLMKMNSRCAEEPPR
jgi:PAS domain S-box-containing protein